MRVLHFIPVYKPAWQYGGPVRSVSKLCEGLAAQGIDTTVATTNANGAGRLSVHTHAKTWVDGVKVYYFERSFPPFYIESYSLRRSLRRLISQADLIHLSAVWHPLELAVASAARDAHKPYVCSLRGCVNPWVWKTLHLKHKVYWHLFESKVLSQAAALHATCNAERQDALSLGVGTGQRFYVAPNCIDTVNYTNSREFRQVFRQRLSIPEGCKLILYFGRVHPHKGIELFLDAAADILRSSPDWLYVIAGPGDKNYVEHLKQRIGALRLESQVRIVGLLQDDMRLGALSSADIFTLTSTSENFGMSIVEAMAAGAPVLISDRVGIAHEIQEDQAGVVAPLELNSIRAALKNLIVDEDLRKLYSVRGRACAQQRFETEVVAKQMINVYSDILVSNTGV